MNIINKLLAKEETRVHTSNREYTPTHLEHWMLWIQNNPVLEIPKTFHIA